MGEHDNRYTLITGATGFIGSHVAEKLLRDGSWPVVGIVGRLGGYKNTQKLQKRGAILVEGNFYDPNFLNHVFTEVPIQNVVHLAGIVGEGTGSWRDYYHVNVRGTESLLTISKRKGVEKFIYCSSVGVFGNIPQQTPADENTPLYADNVYHRSKIAAEERVFEYIHKGLNAYIIRPTITYGERDSGFPDTLVRLVRKRRLYLPFRDTRIHLLSVNGLAEIFLKLLRLNGIKNRVFMAADEGPVVLRDLVNIIHLHYFGREYPRFLHLPSWVFDSFKIICRIVHLPRTLGKLQRISEDWVFKTRRTDTMINFEPLDTKSEFLKYLHTLK